MLENELGNLYKNRVECTWTAVCVVIPRSIINEYMSSNNCRPVRIRARIDPLHPLVCRTKRLNGDPSGSGLELILHIPLCVVGGGLKGAVLLMGPGGPRPCVTAGVTRERSLPAQRPWAPSIGLNFAARHRQW
jgi:hypothetical protein